MLIHRFARNSEILKVSFLIPMAIPISAVVLIWKILFNEQGILSGLLVHLESNGIDWMNSKYAFGTVSYTHLITVVSCQKINMPL